MPDPETNGHSQYPIYLHSHHHNIEHVANMSESVATLDGSPPGLHRNHRATGQEAENTKVATLPSVPRPTTLKESQKNDLPVDVTIDLTVTDLTIEIIETSWPAAHNFPNRAFGEDGTSGRPPTELLDDVPLRTLEAGDTIVVHCTNLRDLLAKPLFGQEVPLQFGMHIINEKGVPVVGQINTINFTDLEWDRNSNPCLGRLIAYGKEMLDVLHIHQLADCSEDKIHKTAASVQLTATPMHDATRLIHMHRFKTDSTYRHLHAPLKGECASCGRKDHVARECRKPGKFGYISACPCNSNKHYPFACHIWPEWPMWEFVYWFYLRRINLPPFQLCEIWVPYPGEWDAALKVTEFLRTTIGVMAICKPYWEAWNLQTLSPECVMKAFEPTKKWETCDYTRPGEVLYYAPAPKREFGDAAWPGTFVIGQRSNFPRSAMFCSNARRRDARAKTNEDGSLSSEQVVSTVMRLSHAQQQAAFGEFLMKALNNEATMEAIIFGDPGSCAKEAIDDFLSKDESLKLLKFLEDLSLSRSTDSA